MPSLAEFQRTIAAGILDGEIRAVSWLTKCSVSAAEALSVHRNTVLCALASALRLTFPTVERLTGGDFFDQAAVAFARENPPQVARLSVYGDAFPDFLEEYSPAQGLPYLADVARFDLAIDRAANSPLDSYAQPVQVNEKLSLELRTSLICLRVDYPADLIRDAIEGDRVETLADIDMEPRPCCFAVWRGGPGVSVKSLSPVAAAFLATLLDGGSCEEALTAALEHIASESLDRIQAEIVTTWVGIQAEIFTAPFARTTNK